MTVRELIEKLKVFPDDMEVLNHEYRDISKVYKEGYPYVPEKAPESMFKIKYVIIK